MKLKKQAFKNNIPIASMSDIAFLLLIFIIIISLSSTKNYDVRLPDSNSMIREDRNNCINILVPLNNDVLINGISTQGIEKKIIQRLKKEGSNMKIKLIADRDLPFIKIKKILKILEKRELSEIQFVVKK